MADASLTLSAWNAGEPVAVDDNATDSVPYTKLMFGPSGTRTHVEAAAGLPVTPDSGGFAVTVSSGTITADLGANNDVTVTSGAITETNSTAILADTASMDTNLGTIAAVDFATQTTLAAINTKLATGTIIGDVNVVGASAASLALIDDAIFADSAIFTPGTDKLIAIGGAVLTGAPTYTTGDVAALSLDTSGALRVTGSSGSTQYAEDAPHASGNTGTMALVVRNDTLAALAGTDGDYAPLQVDANGALYVNATAGSAEVVLGTATYTEATSAGVAIATVRRDADTPLADTTNEFAPLITDANGYLKVEIFDGGGTHTVDNAGTFVIQEDGAALTALQLIGDAIYADSAIFTAGTDKLMAVGGTVLTGAPTYTSGDVAGLSLTTGGALRVSGSSGVTEYTLGTATYTEASSVGNIAGVVRFDAGGTLVNTDNEITSLQVDANGALRVTGGGGGTEYTEDVATANPIVGTATLMERDDALTTVTPVEGDWISFRGTAEGALWVQDFNSDAALTFLTQIDADTSNINTNINTIASAIKVSGTATYTETTTEALVAGAVRNDAGGTLVNTTNEIGPLQMDSAGNLRVNIAAGSTAGPTDTEDDAVAAGQSAGLNMALAYVHDGTDWSRAAAGTGVRTLQTQRVTIATDDLVPITAASLPLPTDAATQTTLAAINAKLVTGTDIGDVTINNASGASAVNIQDGGNSITVDGTITANAGTGTMAVSLASVPSHAVTNAGTFAVQLSAAGGLTALQLIGNPIVAHDAAISGSTGVNVVGFNARSAEPTAVATADATQGLATLTGKQVVLPFALSQSSWSYASTAAVTDTADDIAKAAAGAGILNYVTGVQVFNGSDTVGTEVVIKQGSTVIWRGWAEQTGGGCSATFSPPLKSAANAAINVANITNGSSTYFNLQGYTSVET